jgi:hypothetical protein
MLARFQGSTDVYRATFDSVCAVMMTSAYSVGGSSVAQQIIEFASSVIAHVNNECAQHAILAIATVATANVSVSTELKGSVSSAIEACVHTVLRPPLIDDNVAALFTLLTRVLALHGPHMLSPGTLPAVMNTFVIAAYSAGL